MTLRHSWIRSHSCTGSGSTCQRLRRRHHLAHPLGEEGRERKLAAIVAGDLRFGSLVRVT